MQLIPSNSPTFFRIEVNPFTVYWAPIRDMCYYYLKGKEAEIYLLNNMQSNTFHQ